MAMSYRGVCNACRRTSADCGPAPPTPFGDELSNLYCPACHAAGRAAYEPPAPADDWYWAVATVGVLASILAFGAAFNITWGRMGAPYP